MNWRSRRKASYCGRQFTVKRSQKKKTTEASYGRDWCNVMGSMPRSRTPILGVSRIQRSVAHALTEIGSASIVDAASWVVTRLKSRACVGS